MAALNGDDLEDEAYLEGEEPNSEFYALLNVNKDASTKEIKSAYRRLCILYHPDKYPDVDKKRVAEKLFHKLKEAYEVLSDPRRRAIYDRRGKKGLDSDMQLVEHVTVPLELMEEYERFHKWWEERVYVQKSNPSGLFKMYLDARELVDGTMYDEVGSLKLRKIAFNQSVDAQLTRSMSSTIMGVGAVQGYSMLGGLQLSLRRILSNRSWVSMAIMATNQPSLSAEFYHNLTNRTSLQANGQVYLSPYGMLMDTSLTTTHHFTASTIGQVTVRDLSVSSVKAKIVHQVSPRLKLLAAVETGFRQSYGKLQVSFEPIPTYHLTGCIKVSSNSGLWFSYGIDHEIAEMTSIGTFVEVFASGGVAIRLRLNRTTQSYGVHVLLSDTTNLATVLYATLLPLGVFACVKALALTPYLRRRKDEDLKVRREALVKETAERRQEAEQAVELMSAGLQRILQSEQARHGLIIVKACYGKLFLGAGDNEQLPLSTEDPQVIDVRIPLQVLVKDSKLILPSTSKAKITGFYDPCVGEKKHLRVSYQFRGASHEVTIENMESLVIPRQSHVVTR